MVIRQAKNDGRAATQDRLLHVRALRPFHRLVPIWLGVAVVLAVASSTFGEQVSEKSASESRSVETVTDTEALPGAPPSDLGEADRTLGGDFTSPGGTTVDRPCIDEPLDPLPSNGCYTCVSIDPGNGCPVTIRCAEATTNGKKSCSITIGGGSVACTTSGAHCTTV